MPICVSIFGKEGVILHNNPAALKELGFPQAALLGKKLLEVVPDSDHDAAMEIMVGLRDQGAYNGQHRIVRAQNDTIWIEARTVKFDTGLYGSFWRNITKEKADQEALEAERLRFRHLFENSPAATWLEDLTDLIAWMEVLKTNGVTSLRDYIEKNPTEYTKALKLIHVLDINQAAVEQNGARDKQHLIENLHQLLGPESQSAAIGEFEAFFRGETRYEYEVRSKRLDGRIATLLVRFDVPVDQGKPDFSRVVISSTDITEIKRLAEDLVQAQKLEAIGRLAGGVAHDFNNILAAILLQVSMLRSEDNLSAEMNSALKEVQDEAERAAKLTGQLLTFSRKRSLLSVSVDLNAVIASLSNMLQRLLGEKVDLRIHLDPELPPVTGDATMLQQVVMNLAVNARDAMPKGGRLTISTDRTHIPPHAKNLKGGASPGDFAHITVRDEGKGMSKETLQHIFEPFFTTKSVGKGTGLGLATVFGIIQQHKGWIDVESEVERGSCFHIYVPLEKSPSFGAPAHHIQLSPPKGNGERILLVEDEPSIRSMLIKTLQHLGYSVWAAADPSAALSLWREFGGNFDLLFTDMVMPGGMDGLELSNKVREEKPDLRVIVSTGYSEEFNRLNASAHNNVTLLAKPYSVALLAERLHRQFHP